MSIRGRALVLCAVIAIVYVALAPAHVVAGDNAEFAALAAAGGRAHPSGYPLYVLWLRAWSWLPVGSVAHRAAIATALIAAAAAFALHAACRAWGARESAASFAVAIFAAAPVVLRVHTEADVFALNSLVGAVVLLIAAADGPLRGMRRGGALGAVAGLGLANNLTCVLLAPVGIYGVVLAIREAPRALAAAALAVGALALGLAPYLYLLVAPDATSWSQPVHGVGDLLAIFLRRDYGTWEHVPGSASVPIADSVLAHAALVGRSWLYAPALAGVAMLAIGCRRWDGRALAASWLLAGPLLAWRLDVETSGVGGYIGGRMQILSMVVLAIGVARGFDVLAARLPRGWPPARATAAATAVFVVLTAAAWPRLSRVHSQIVETGARRMLEWLPDRAIAVIISDDQCFASRYLQLADDVRTDATIICWTLTTRDWYRAQLAAQGVTIAPPATAGPMSLAQADALLATGRPLVVDDAQTIALAQRPSYPLGLLDRVLPAGTASPSPRELFERNRALYATMDPDEPRPDRDDDLAALAYRRYAHTWRVIANALAAAGDQDGATTAATISHDLAPEGP